MSVINQMLKDLDQRQSPVSSPARGRHPKRRQGPSPWLWLALVVAALVFFFFGLPEYGQKPPRLIDTPGNKEPRVYVLRPGEPATSQPATATSTAATASSTVATTGAPEQPAVSPSADTAAKGNTSVSANTAALNTITQQATPATQPERSDLSMPDQASSTPAQASSTPLTVASVPVLSAAPTPAVPNYQVATAPRVNSRVSQDTAVSSSNAVADARAADTQVAALSRSNDFPAPTPAASMSVQRLDKTPEVPSPWLQQAHDAMLQGNWSLARQRWQQVLVQQPTLTEGYLQLATVLEQQQDWSALQALLHQAQQHGVSHARLELAQLRLLASGQQWQSLLSSLTPALESQGGVVLALKAKAQQQLGQWQAAALTYQQWQRQEPSQARAFLGEALLLEQQGQVQAARPKFQHALTLGGLAPQTTHYIQQRLSTQGSD